MVEKNIRAKNGINFIAEGDKKFVEETEVKTRESFEKIDSENELFENDVYSRGEHNKLVDFFIGFGMCYGFGVILGLISFIPVLIISGISTPINSNFIVSGLFTAGVVPIFGIAGFVLPLICTLLVAKKYFSERRLVRVGAWVAFVLPLLAILLFFGACLIILSNSGW